MQLFSFSKQKKNAASPKKATRGLPGPNNSHKNAFFQDDETADTLNLHHSPSSHSRNRQGCANNRTSTGDRASPLSLPSLQSPSTNSRSHVDSVSSSSQQQQAQQQASECEKASEVSMPRLQRASGALTGTPNARTSSSTGFPVHGATAALPARRSAATDPPASKSATINSTPATPRQDLTSPIRQPPVARLLPSKVCTVRKPSVHFVSPLPEDCGKKPPIGFPDRMAVPSPPSVTATSAQKGQPPALPKSRHVAPAVVPPAPQRLPPRTISLPVFTAMESVPKQPGSSFRALKRHKNSYEGANNLPGGPISTRTNGNLSNGTVAAPIEGNAAAGLGRSNNSASGVTLTPFCKERQSNGSCTGSSAHDTEREPVARFADGVDGSQRNPQSNIPAIAHVVPIPPPMNVDKLGSFRGTVGSLLKSTRRTSSMYSNHSTQSSIEVVVSENPTSVRRSQCTNVRLSTPRTMVKVVSSCSLSLDDVPRPLNRHASTLSTEQQEALRRTPSFLTRAHTPPPSNLRDLVQVRKGRRLLQVRCNTPDVHSAAPGVRSASEQSLSSSPMVMLSGLPPSGSDDGKSTAHSLARSTEHASPLLGHGKKGDASGQPLKDPVATCSGAVSPNGPSDSGSHCSFRNGGRTAEWRANDARLLSEAGASSEAPRPSSCETIKPRPRAPHIPSPPPLHHHHTSEPGLAEVSPPPLSSSPDPVATSTAVSQDLHKNTSSSMSLLLDEAAEFDFYGSCVLSTLQFNTKPPQRITATPTPADESGSAASVDEVVQGQQRSSQQEQKPQKPEMSRNGTAGSAAVKAKGQNDVSISVSECVRLSVTDLLGAASGKTAAKATDTRTDDEATSAETPNQSKSSAKHVRTVRPASRQRVVSAYVDDDEDEDEDGFYQVSRTILKPASASAKQQGTSYRGPSLVPPSPRENGHHYLAAIPGSAKPSQPLRETPPTPAAAKPAAVAAPLRAQLDLSWNDDSDDDNEEEYDNLLEGFHPAGFDARRGARSSNSIVFYLDKEDSVSSTDVVVRAASIPRGSWAIPFSLADTKLLPLDQKPQSEYSMLKLSTTVKTGGGGARPHITFDPYIAENTHPAAQLTSSEPSSTLPDSHVNKSLSLHGNLDQYDFVIDSSYSSLLLNANVRGSRTALSRNSASGVQSKASTPSAPVSIFLGTTLRFAPDKSKMHRPLANTFGYTNAQRRARAAAMAAGVNAEEWARAAGIDEDDVDSEDGVYGEVYTDENGDEWYWEEVEDEECEEDEDEDEGNARDSACALEKGGAGVRRSPAPTSSVSGVTATATR
ncbi:conserved hypothetical protein [Leishmania infantum JPCM5]|uniref:Uncharacterized protein n=2 Tax=Leishmania infantum TaxID=5671 RepID=A4I6Q0_LEIIN|nr:conserved hypothetical protein [Leishmania infantum JPCM5]CAC9518882.1 hypothetical_protein_-_conserved [Leishmania infantum]CAM70477.1 conserved hypothetical protein [Leishmania infantum JPCM5]SUZ44339.1 hypothetical_protein_-_conserved [Leishmania infantum]|eukprot:XP_001467419.1 conserved hypothetical protein [Leishmania infantum JPCM5]